MSHYGMLKKIDAFGENYDEEVNKWKSDLEHSCKKQSVLSTILEVVEDAEKEIVPDGLTTLNVADLDLSFAVQSQPQHPACLSVAEIKEHVKLMMKEKFDEHGLNYIADKILKSAAA